MASTMPLVGQMNGIGLCRGDIAPDGCRSCISNFSHDIIYDYVPNTNCISRIARQDTPIALFLAEKSISRITFSMESSLCCWFGEPGNWRWRGHNLENSSLLYLACCRSVFTLGPFIFHTQCWKRKSRRAFVFYVNMGGYWRGEGMAPY